MVKTSSDKSKFQFNRPNRHLCVALLVMLTAPLSANADWRPHQLLLSGADDRVWLVGASKAEGDDLPEVRFWTSMADTAALPKQRINLRPVSGEPLAAAADSSALRALYGDLSLWRYDALSAPATDALYVTQSAAPPLAFGGDASTDVSWFLVDADTLYPPKSETQPAADEAPSTQPATSQPAPTTMPAAAPERLVLLRLERGFWSRFDVPDFASRHDTYRLAIRNQRVCLLWLDARKNRISCAEFADNTWSQPTIAVDGVVIDEFWAGPSVTGPVVIMTTPAGDEKHNHLQIAFRSMDHWIISKPAGVGDTPLLLSPRRVSATIAGDRLAIATLRNGQIRFGWGDISLAPTVRLSKLSTAVPALDSTRQSWRDSIQFVVLLTLFMLMILTRRDQVQAPAAVPQGYVLATLWRRSMATLIDVSPAAILTLLLNWDFLGPLLREAGAADMTIAQNPDVVDRQFRIWIVFVAMYGAWCLLLESLGHTTLGKRILNCRVLSADGAAPTAKQIVIRNVIRMLIVALGPTGVFVSFMLLPIFTVNRQRLGDIMANTIVVQPEPPALEHDGSPPFDDRDNDF
ncbi:MAG: RDD family protein [Phycisphaerales bacterium]|nr:RDD family protein [Phycisphaerales bacterium]